MVREGVVAAGVVSLSGIPTQNQTLAVNVTDVDGISAGAPIVYRWQQSADNGVTWSDILGEANSSLSLQQPYVGRLVRAGVSYTDAAGMQSKRSAPQLQQWATSMTWALPALRVPPFRGRR
jgi:hypothetical protein